jgi:hypothetical protein
MSLDFKILFPEDFMTGLLVKVTIIIIFIKIITLQWPG